MSCATNEQPIASFYHTVQEYTNHMRKRVDLNWNIPDEMPVWFPSEGEYRLTLYSDVKHHISNMHGELDFNRHWPRIIVATEAGKPPIRYMGYRCD